MKFFSHFNFRRTTSNLDCHEAANMDQANNLRTMSLDPGASSGVTPRPQDIGPVPLFKMRNRPSSSSTKTPRPYSYDVGFMVSSHNQDFSGNERSPRNPLLSRIYERRPQGAVGRQAMSARNNYMNLAGNGDYSETQKTGSENLGFKKLAIRSNSQHELIANGTGGEQNLVWHGANGSREYGSTSSIEAAGIQPAAHQPLTSTPNSKLGNRRTIQPLHSRSKSSQLSSVRETTGLNAPPDRADSGPIMYSSMSGGPGGFGGAVSMNYPSAPSVSQASNFALTSVKQQNGALSGRSSAGESILRRLKLTASRSSGGGGSSSGNSSTVPANNTRSPHEYNSSTTQASTSLIQDSKQQQVETQQQHLASAKNHVTSALVANLHERQLMNKEATHLVQDLASAVLSSEEFSNFVSEVECPKTRVSKVVSYLDCGSLAAAWEMGVPSASVDPGKPTGASQAQSPSEEDPGDGKENYLLQSCPAFRNELGREPVRRLALNRHVLNSPSAVNQCSAVGGSEFETWHREATASEAGVLENLSNVYLGGRLCAARQPQLVIEPPDPGAFYYRHCFAGRSHHNYFGVDEVLGPLAISLVKERLEDKEAKLGGLQSNGIYRAIVRLSDLRTFRVSVPEDCLGDGVGSKGMPLRELLDMLLPRVSLSCLRLGLPVPRTEELLLKLDEQPVYTRYKVGILYCKAGQSSEEQMYNNEHAGPSFEEFLEFLGQKVRLKGFDGYKGGLDTRGDTTGTHAYYATYQQHQIMFHVSTCLPYTPSNKQQLSRKRHIGNDMVTVVFQEPGAQPFSPQTVRSHFQHVFIVVRANQPSSDGLAYNVAISRVKDVPAFGPPLPPGATFPKSAEFRDFLLTKIINAENAVHKSDKFAAMAARTRREVLKDLAENHVTGHTADGTSRITTKFLGGGSNIKRKDNRASPKPVYAECIRGALAWEIEVEDFSRGSPISCVMGLSSDSLVLLEKPSGRVIFATPAHSIIGWSSHGNSLSVYYDHGAVLLFRAVEGCESDIAEMIKRLQSVTKGCEAVELVLRRNAAGQLGFHLQEEGVVTDVEMYGQAWQAGLRQGSRLVEISRSSVATLTLNQMEELLLSCGSIPVLVIPQGEDGSPRRGCEDPHCFSLRGITDEESPFGMVPSPPFPVHPPGRQPPSYSETQQRLGNQNLVLRQNSPVARVSDQGYESGTLSKEERGACAPSQEWTLSSVSSEERWRVPPRTDTLSSSGSASSEMSGDMPAQNARRRPARPVDLKRKERISTHQYQNGDDLRHGAKSESNIRDLQTPVYLDRNAPPLPPRTYKCRQGRLSIHEQLLMLCTAGHMSNLHRAQSEELLTFSDLPNGKASPCSSVEGVQSARPVLTGNRSPEWTHLIEAAAKVMAQNPEISSCHLRLQAALQRVKTLEDKVDRLTGDLEKERRLRQEMEAEVTGLREDRERLQEERQAAENELKNFTQWVFKVGGASENPAIQGRAV